MKKILYTFLLIGPLLFIYSCDKDEDPDNTDNNIPTNYVLYDGNYYEMDGPCVIIDYGLWSEEEGINNLDIVIGSSNLYLNENTDDNFELYDTTAVSQVLYFELFTSETMLNSGVYNFDPETQNSMTFDIGEFSVFNDGLDSAFEEDQILYADITAGTVNININTSSSSITIDVDCTTDENKNISAYWEGDYNYYDYRNLFNSSEEFKLNKHINLMK